MAAELDDLGFESEEPTQTTESDEQHADAGDDAGVVEDDQKEAYIAKLKGKVGQINAENQQMRERLAALEGRVDEQRTMLSTPKEPVATTDDPYAMDEEALDTYRNDPAKLIEFSKQRENNLILKLQKVLEMQTQMHRNELMSLKGEIQSRDPERQMHKQAIADLIAKNPKLKSLDEDTLIEIVKTTQPAATEDERPVFRGAPGQGRAAGGGSSVYTRAQAEADFVVFRLLAGTDAGAKELVQRKKAKMEAGYGD